MPMKEKQKVRGEKELTLKKWKNQDTKTQKDDKLERTKKKLTKEKYFRNKNPKKNKSLQLLIYSYLYLKSNPNGVTRVKTDSNIAGYGDHKLNKARMTARKK